MSRPTLLLVHGAWHGSWAFEPLTSILIDRGWTVKTVNANQGPGRPGARGRDKSVLCLHFFLRRTREVRWGLRVGEAKPRTERGRRG